MATMANLLTFRASWRSQIFFCFGAYLALRGFDETVRLLEISPYLVAVVGVLVGLGLAFFYRWRGGTMIAAFFVGYVAFRLFLDFGQSRGAMQTDQRILLIGLFSLSAVIVIAFGKWLRRRDLRMGDALRSELARKALEQATAHAQSGRSLNNALYLRAFASTGQFRAGNPNVTTIGTPEFFEQDHIVSVERMLAEALEKTAPLLALGVPGESRDAGLLETEDEGWKDKVMLLVDAVDLVILMPSAKAGTQWEIGWLRDSGALSKTVWVMPPFSGRNVADGAAFWEDAVRATRENWDLGLPDYQEEGALFAVTGDNKIPYLQEFPDQSLDELREEVMVTRVAAGSPNADRTELAVPVLQKSQTVNYLWIVAGFAALAFLFPSIERQVLVRSFSYNKTFEDTFAKQLRQHDERAGALEPSAGHTAMRNAGERSAKERKSAGEAVPPPAVRGQTVTAGVSEAITSAAQQPASGEESYAEIGLRNQAGLRVPVAWEGKRLGGNNSLTLFSPDRSVTCHASIEDQDVPADLYVLAAQERERALLQQSFGAALKQVGRKLNFSVSVDVKMLKPTRKQYKGYDVSGAVTVRGNFVQVTRARVLVSGSSIARVDCGGPEERIHHHRDGIQSLMEKFSIRGATNAAGRKRSKLDTGIVDLAISKALGFAESNDHARSLQAAAAGLRYIFEHTERSEHGRPRLSTPELIGKTSFLMLQIGKAADASGDTKTAIQNYEKSLELWKGAGGALADVADTQKRLAELYEEVGEKDLAAKLREELRTVDKLK